MSCSTHLARRKSDDELSRHRGQGDAPGRPRMEAVILAGGLGTRLGSRLVDRPKPMVPVAGRPFLRILLDRLVDAGCDRIIVSVGYLRHVIIESFGNSYREIPLIYSIEEAPLGTGGALRLALTQVSGSDALVVNGDTYLHADFSVIMEAHRASGRPMTMAVTRVKDRSRYGGLIVENGHVTGFAEKSCADSGWINAGVYVLNSTFPWPQDLPVQFSFENDVLTPCLTLLRPAAFLCDGYFLDIGYPEDLERAQTELSARSIQFRNNHKSQRPQIRPPLSQENRA